MRRTTVLWLLFLSVLPYHARGATPSLLTFSPTLVNWLAVPGDLKSVVPGDGSPSICDRFGAISDVAYSQSEKVFYGVADACSSSKQQIARVHKFTLAVDPDTGVIAHRLHELVHITEDLHVAAMVCVLLHIY